MKEAKRPPQDYSAALVEQNIAKNRYGNILPRTTNATQLDFCPAVALTKTKKTATVRVAAHSRVKLRIVNDDQYSDFINANYVDVRIGNARKNG